MTNGHWNADSENDNNRARVTETLPASFISTVHRLGFIVHDVPRDGDCLFAAAADNLSRACPHGTYTSSRLRQGAITYLTRHPYSPHTSAHLSEFLSDENWDHYLRRMSQDGEWADHLTLTALAEWLQSRILVYNENAFHPTTVEPQTYISASRRPRDYRRTITLGLVGNSHYVSLEELRRSESTDAAGDKSDTSEDNDDSSSETEEGFHVVHSSGILVGDGNTQYSTVNMAPLVEGRCHQTVFNVVGGTNSKQILLLNVHCVIQDGVVDLIKDMLEQAKNSSGNGTSISIKIKPVGLNGAQEAEYADAEREAIKTLKEERREELQKSIDQLGGKVIAIDNGCIEIILMLNNWKHVAKFARNFYEGRFKNTVETIFSRFQGHINIPENSMLRVTCTMNIKRSQNNIQDPDVSVAAEGVQKQYTDELKRHSDDIQSENYAAKTVPSGIRVKIAPTSGMHRPESVPFIDETAINDHVQNITKKLILCATQGTSLTGQLDIGVTISKEDVDTNQQTKRHMTPTEVSMCETRELDSSPTYRLETNNQSAGQDDDAQKTPVSQFSSLPNIRKIRGIQGRGIIRRIKSRWRDTCTPMETVLRLTGEVQHSTGLLIGGKTPYGNGFRIGKSYIFTCYHVVTCITGRPDCINKDKNMEISVFFDGKANTIEASLEFKSESLDVALLKVINSDTPLPGHLSNITHVFPGDPFYLVGHPSGTKKTAVEKGVFRNTLGQNMPFDTSSNVTFETKSFHHGSSGSACVLLKHGRVYVGAMLVGGYTDQSEGSTGIIHYGVRMSAVYDRLMEENPELGDKVFFPRILNLAEQAFNAQSEGFDRDCEFRYSI